MSLASSLSAEPRLDSSAFALTGAAALGVPERPATQRCHPTGREMVLGQITKRKQHQIPVPTTAIPR